MNLDALSDLVLALACAWVFNHQRRVRPGVALAALLVGVAACLGVLRFSGVEPLSGPHRFASLVAAVAAFPLLALSLAWPADPVAHRWNAAGRFVVLASALGIALVVGGVAWWSKLAPALSALLILATMLRLRNSTGLLGAVLLLASFAATLVLAAHAERMGPFSPVQALHYLMAAAWVALVRAPYHRISLA